MKGTDNAVCQRGADAAAVSTPTAGDSCPSTDDERSTTQTAHGYTNHVNEQRSKYMDAVRN